MQFLTNSEVDLNSEEHQLKLVSIADEFKNAILETTKETGKGTNRDNEKNIIDEELISCHVDDFMKEMDAMSKNFDTWLKDITVRPVNICLEKAVSDLNKTFKYAYLVTYRDVEEHNRKNTNSKYPDEFVENIKQKSETDRFVI